MGFSHISQYVRISVYFIHKVITAPGYKIRLRIHKFTARMKKDAEGLLKKEEKSG